MCGRGMGHNFKLLLWSFFSGAEYATDGVEGSVMGAP